jgi:hypothetical protein
LLEGEFMGKKIINNHGPLLKMYYSYGDGNPPLGEIEDIYSSMEKAKKNQWGSFGQYDFISEGDSPAFLHLADVGLDNLENPNNGGWGGRLAQSATSPNRWEDGDAVAEMNPYTKKTDKAFGQIRWLAAIQNDFAARADWCIKDFKDANHAPSVTIKGPKVRLVKPNQKINIVSNTNDPDGHTVALKFWQYEEVDTYNGKIDLMSNGNKASFKIPANLKKGETIHVIVEATDNGEPQLTRYQRIVLTGK